MADKILSIGLGINTSSLPKDINEATAIIKAGAEKIGGATGAASEGFKTLSQAVRQSTKDAEVIGMYLGSSSNEFKAAAERVQGYKAQLQDVHTAIGAAADGMVNKQMPSIKQVSSGYNGLNMSINQLSRELPAFTYSMQTGFMAISNNIPMLVDQLNILKAKNLELAASGQQTQSTMKAIAGAIFSWQSAISIGVTLMTVFGGKLITYISDQYDTAKATAAAAAAQKKQNENLETYQRILNGLTTSVKNHNSELRLQLAAKEAGISVDEMKALNLEKTISAKEKLLIEKQKALAKIDTEEYSGKGRQLALDMKVDSTTISNLQKQIEALKNYQNVLKESASLSDKINQKTKSNNTNTSDKTSLQLDYNGLGEQKEISSRKLDVASIDNGLLKLKELRKLVPKEPYFISFKMDGLDKIQIAGQRIAVLKDGIKSLGDTLMKSVVPALSTFGNALGKSLGGEKIDGGQALKAMLADICNAMAMTMYAMASAFFVIADYGHAAAATAAGIGLNVVAGVLGAQASSGVSSSSSSSSSSAGNIGTYGSGNTSNFGVLQIGGQVRGNNLLISVNRSGYERSRVR